MTEAVFQFKAIAQKLNRQEQKAEFEAKNPVPETGMYGWPYGVAMPLADGCGSDQAGRITGGACESVTLATVDLPQFESVPSYGAPRPGLDGGSPSEWNAYYRGLMVQRVKI